MANGISGSQIQALMLAKLEGNVFAGYNISKGSRIKVQYSTLLACAKRGWLYLADTHDCGVFGRLTPAGAALGCISG